MKKTPIATPKGSRVCDPVPESAVVVVVAVVVAVTVVDMGRDSSAVGMAVPATGVLRRVMLPSPMFMHPDALGINVVLALMSAIRAASAMLSIPSLVQIPAERRSAAAASAFSSIKSEILIRHLPHHHVCNLLKRSYTCTGTQVTSEIADGHKHMGNKGKPISKNTLFTWASLTKPPTTIAALQLVEKGSIQLDDDVSSILPVLGRQPILSGWADDGSPILRKRRNPITLRHLLTHSAGTGYDFMSQELQKLHSSRGTVPSQGATIDERFDLPLLFEPGEGWEYGCGVDWAGKIVEQLTGISLEAYLHKNVWAPLGATSFTFWPDKNNSRGAELATLTRRIRKTGKLAEIKQGLGINIGATDCFGGHGGHGTAGDLAELLSSILANDGRVLTPRMVDVMFENQLSPQSQSVLQNAMRDPTWSVGDFYPGETYNWGLGGMLINGSTNSKAPFNRGARTLVWSGAAHQFWFIDREKGVCGLFMTQVLSPPPVADAKIRDLTRAWQQYVYQQVDGRRNVVGKL
ncbi:hypothetical protein S40288_03386 [Stachybotrys chartarum IBT 40288]|nr:hypothetical protein S40288_03386 [Stachybotrys chartarum IBT 40288]